jgi:hypothetical protein
MPAAKGAIMQADHLELLRKAVNSILGAPPDDAPLDAQTIAVTHKPDHRCEHVTFQVSPRDWCLAYVLIPKNLARPAPAIYLQHGGDYARGKAEFISENGPTHPLATDLVARGYVVFIPDLLGYGERRAPQSDGPLYDHGYLVHQLSTRLLRGETLLRKTLWDTARGVDYLETRPEVNKKALAFVGKGNGGRLAIWAMAYDSRLRVGMAQGGMSLYSMAAKRNEWTPTEFIVPRLTQVADLNMILTLVAPRPFLISALAGETDNPDAFDIWRRAQPVYERFGAKNKLSLYTHPERANQQADLTAKAARFSAYTWLDSWLKSG